MGTALLVATSLSRGRMVISLMAAGLVIDVRLVSAALCLRARLYAQLLDECSGTLKAGIAQSFEFSPLAGVPVLLKEAPCLRCHACGTETLRGDIISAVLSDFKSVFLKYYRRWPFQTSCSSDVHPLQHYDPRRGDVRKLGAAFQDSVQVFPSSRALLDDIYHRARQRTRG